MKNQKCLFIYFRNLIIFGLITLSPPTGAFAEGELLSNTAETGKQLYQKYCSSCHGDGGLGDGPVATALKTPPADLTQISKRRGGEFPSQEIAKIIDGQLVQAAHGTRDMPVWGLAFGEPFGGGVIGEEVARGNLSVLVDYLKSIQR